ncbi:MAG: metal ABC transporter permease [Rickettsiales bacterium]|jgi:zinc transport system permease protein|nr:metal ABC transporter permease [Rickettsiales bacterium]
MSELTVFFYPIVAALVLAAIAGPIGCFINWRRMAFYSDTLSHAALLGIALGLLVGVGAAWGVLLVALLASLLLLWLQRQAHVALDTLLAILAQASLAGGILLIYTQPQLQVNLYGFLFGDVLSISDDDAFIILAGGVVVLLAMLRNWRPMLLVTMHEELAQAEGIHVFRVQALLLVLMAITVAIGIYVAGVMMVSSLLVIPAASARAFTKTPSAMVIAASFMGIISVTAGLMTSFHYDLPPGPTIVLWAAALFVATRVATVAREPRK